MNVTVNGVADNEDVDYFVVEAKKGERITAEVEGLRLGITEFDPYVAILNVEAVRARRPATTRPWSGRMGSRRSSPPRMASTSSRCARAPTPATAAASTACTSAISRGRRPMLPAGGKPGETLAVRWIGDPAGETTSTDQASRRPSNAISASSARTTRASLPIPTPSASRRSAT